MINNKSLFKTIQIILLIFFVSLGTIGGCGNNNSNNEDDDPGLGNPGETSSCINPSEACKQVTEHENRVSCTLSDDTCGVDLKDVLSEVISKTSNNFTNDTVIWIEAWGGKGGRSQIFPGEFNEGGKEGYAQTTTSIDDFEMNLGTTQIYYYLGEDGDEGSKDANTCVNGSPASGGASTILTLDDLTLNPDINPSGEDIILLAGGGGGAAGCSGGGKSCDGVSVSGGEGGIAIADQSKDAVGASPKGKYTAGGGDLGKGGKEFCIYCDNGKGEDGKDEFGGIGGKGGKGRGNATTGNCPAVERSFWKNTGNLKLEFSNGEGGEGGTFEMGAGGGGGGGGWGGGGGGGSTDSFLSAVWGGGGGSFALQSTQVSVNAPDKLPDNPCDKDGCVQINFEF